ncbi:hypothetical protein [Dokdonella soli]|uniref:Uncharacterized protein n=1 Tax=Dokdonella soli TaxID=529810 RepID=A0ABP3TM42_9GAMM
MTTHPCRHIRVVLFAGLALGSGSACAQVLTNGDFETGNLTGWTTGGTNAAAVIRASDITPSPATATVPQPPGAPATNYFAILSNGPGDLGGAAQFYDANTTSDYDLGTLSQTITLPFAPAVISFDWNFPTSEQDQGDTFDDLFDLRANNTQIWSGSSCKNNGSNYSNFPSAPCSGLAQNTWTVTGAAAGIAQNTQLRFGIGSWQHVCVPLPSSLTAGSAVTLRYAVLDQGDASYDSALLLDNIRIASACDATRNDALRQLSNTSGQNVTLKNGSIVVRPVTNTKPAIDDSGTSAAFISNANLTADNPNLLAQVFTWNGASFARATPLIVDATGNINGVALSGALDSGYKGRYVAIAAQLTSSGSAQIYRYDRSSGALSSVTATTNCDTNGQYALDNVNPFISTDGSRIAWESECASLTGAANGVKRVVYADFNGTNWTGKAPFTDLTSCVARNPRLNRSGNGRYLAFESTCNPTLTGNTAGNTVVFRYDTTKTGVTAFVQEMTGSSTALAASPSLDSSGRYTLYLSVNASSGHSEIWRYDATAASNTQLTTTSTSTIFLDVYAAGDSTRFAYERQDLGTNFSEVGYGTISGSTATLTPVGQGYANPLGGPALITGARIGMDTTTPVVTFYSDFDFLGTNTDVNSELFQARGQ